jgi:hypothetical protein
MTANHVNARRRRLVLGAGATAAVWSTAHTKEPRRFAVISLLGDKLEFVYPASTTGTNLDRNARQNLDDPKGAFDQIALKVVAGVIEKSEPGAQVTLLGIPPSPLHDQPEKLISGNSVGLPGAAITTIEQAQATHVVLLTKYRSEARLPLLDSFVGTGFLRGLGFYLDSDMRLLLTNSRESGAGFIATYAYVRLTLADARTGAVIKQRLMKAAKVDAVAGSEKATNPWDVLSAEEKISRLKSLLEQELAIEMLALIAGS